LAISALVTTEGIAKANALNASGFLITIPTFSVSAVAGAIAATRTFTSKNATFFTATVTSVAIASDTTVNYTCTIPAGSILAATAVLEIYLEDTATNTLYVVGQPEASTPIVVDPAGSTTIVMSVTMSSIASSSYNLVNTASTDLTNHESNLAMHPKTNYAATVAPTTADDGAAGYSEGSIWVDTVTNIGYVLLDKGNGAAVWGKIAPQSSGATNNFAAITAPAAANDSTQGYSIGSVWVDTLTDQSYTLVDDTAGAAVWTQTTGGGSAGSVSAAVPTSPLAGDLWHNTANDLTYIYDGSAWIDIVNAGTGNAKTNYSATIAPTATDDSGAGYSRGSVWVDAVAGVAYTMVDSTAGAAVWEQTTYAAGAAAEVAAGRTNSVKRADGTWSARVRNLPQDYALQTWADDLAIGAYDVSITVAQNGLPIGWWYIEVLRHTGDNVTNQYRYLRATPLGTTLATLPVYHCSDVLGTWSAWTPVGDNPLTWFTPTFVNSWADFAGGFDARYTKDLTTGIVYMKGLVGGGSNTIDTTIFTLPVGMRPSSNLMLNRSTAGGSGRFDINSTGVVNFAGLETHTGNATIWLSISATFKGEL